MRMRWLATLVLAPAGVALGHASGYLLAYPDAHARYRALSGHGHFRLFMLGALALAAGLLLQASLSQRRGRVTRVDPGPLLVAQALAFVGLEAAERLASVGHAQTLTADPAFWLGLAAQAATAWWLAAGVRCAPRLAAAFMPRRQPVAAPAAASGPWGAADVPVLTSSPCGRSQRPRAPPSALICC
ncbi:MAG: hypothetical protein M3276_10015 [Actinomycetota bacterium]|nr:hypothetical protein [Actinomycetota bacterium]